MVMPTLVDMSMFQLFGSGITQVNDLDVEMQLIARQRVIKVQSHIFPFDGIDARIAGLAGIVPDGQLQTFLHGHILGKLVARHFNEGFLIILPIRICGRNDHILAFADLHAHHLTLETGNDIPITDQKLQWILALGGVNFLAIHMQCIFHRNDHIILN